MKRPAIKPPRFLADLYRDLRDRRLLPLVVVLLVAIPALPLLLGNEAETPVPLPAPDAALAAEEIPTLPAVLASDPGLRDYRERLEALDSKNPFAQDFAPPSAAATGGSKADVAAAEGGSTAPATTEPVNGGTTDTSGSTPSDPGSPSGTEPTPTTPPTGGVKEYLIHHELDLEIDGPEDKRKFENVRELETLPGKKTPLLVFGGVTADEKQAVFLLSKDIVKTDGDGQCSPARDDCQLLALGEGDQRKLWYSARGGAAERYIVKLHDIERVIERIK